MADQQLSGLASAISNPATARLVDACERRELTAWEKEFVASIRTRWRTPTDKQMAILNRIAEGPPDYGAINAAALRRLADLLDRWLPGGEVSGHEYSALNPRRGDHHAGSFRVNLHSCLWADFATGDGGRDPVSLAAYLFDLPQPEAARRVAGMLGMALDGGAHG